MFAMDIVMLRLLLISAIIALGLVLLIVKYRRKKVFVRGNKSTDVRIGPLFDIEEEKIPVPAAEESVDPDSDEDTKVAPVLAAVPEPNKRNVISINLRARRREGFDGKQLLATFYRFNLEYGEMDIFHRKLQIGSQQVVSFSVLNGEEPGTLKCEELEESSTPVIIFFIRLYNSHKPLRSFDEMVDVSKQIAYLLDGQLYDDQGSNMTEQSLEYYRSVIKKFILQEKTRRRQVYGCEI